jgi:hypothetical protein
MNKIQDVSKNNNLLPTETMIRKVFQETTEDSKLGLYCSLVLVFYLPEKVAESRHSEKGFDNFRKVVNKDLHMILDLCKDNEKLFERHI